MSGSLVTVSTDRTRLKALTVSVLAAMAVIGRWTRPPR